MHLSTYGYNLSKIVLCLCLLSNVYGELVDIEQYKGYIQRVHNYLRARQYAADMKYLYWDVDLESRAGMWSEGCRFEHQMDGYGENLAFLSSTGTRRPQILRTIRDGMRNWYNEIRMWRRRRTLRERRQFCGQTCHFTQMAWSRTSHLGCTVSYCPVLSDDRGRTYRNAMYFVCFYYPQGNIVGQLPFLNGPACSRCSADRPTCRDGLCAAEDSSIRQRRSVRQSWLCQSPKLSCSNNNILSKCLHTCSEKSKDKKIPKQDNHINSLVIKHEKIDEK